MYWKRLSHALLLGMGFSVLGVGCAAVDALVSSPAGRSADRGSTQRMAAIGRVFENQGRYAKAEAMYRSALKADPSNSVARSRLEYVAGMKAQRKFDATNRDTLDAFAMADALTTRPGSKATSKAPKVSAKPDLKSVLKDTTVVASLTPAPRKAGQTVGTIVTSEAISVNGEAEAIEQPLAEPKVEIVTASTDIGDVGIVDTGWELAGMLDDRPLSESWSEVASTFAEEVSGIATVNFEGEESGMISAAVMQPDWKSASGRISLEDVLAWSEDVDTNRVDLLLGLSQGEDDGVKALAAAVLTETDHGDAEVNAALDRASRGGSDFLKVTALDALVQRNALNRDTVSGLLSLLRSQDGEIRTQSATSLRHLVSTDWSNDCVDGLVELLADSEPGVVAIAATTLGDFGPEATAFRDDLMVVSEDCDDAMVNEAVELALQRIPAGRQNGIGIALPPANEIEIKAGGYLPFAE